MKLLSNSMAANNAISVSSFHSKTVKNFAIFLNILLLISCNSEDNDSNDIPTSESTPVNINVSLQNNPTIEFANGSCIGVSIATGDAIPTAEDSNHPYTYNDGKWIQDDKTLNWHDAGTMHILRAYSPYSKENVDVDILNFSLPTKDGKIDLSTAKAYTSADITWGQISTTPKNDLTNIPMDHRMAQIIIHLTPGTASQSDVNSTIVELLPFEKNNFLVEGTMDLMNANVFCTYPPKTIVSSLIPLKHAKANIFYALVVPEQMFRMGEFIRLKNAEGTELPCIPTLMFSESKTFTAKAGCSYEFFIRINTQNAIGSGNLSQKWSEPTEGITEKIPNILNIENIAGGLENQLTEKKDTELSITGTMNNADMATLKRYIQSKEVTRIRIDATGVEEIEGTFNGCISLTYIDLPKATSIGDWTFTSCTDLEYVNLPQATKIGGNAFNSCKKITNLYLPKVTSLERAAFIGCTGLKSVNLPQINKIGDSAFYGCTSLTEMDLSATEIGGQIFMGCTTLKSVKLDKATQSSNGIFKDCKSLITVSMKKLTSIWYSSFEGCIALESVDLSETSTLIGNVFEGCMSLKSVNLPEVTKIDIAAFKDCKSLSFINLPKVTSIGENAFKGCQTLKCAILPEVTTFGTKAFEGCEKLEKLVISGENENQLSTAIIYPLPVLYLAKHTYNEFRPNGIGYTQWPAIYSDYKGIGALDNPTSYNEQWKTNQ